MRDLFAPADRPVIVEKAPEKPTDFRTRWAELTEVVRELWGQSQAYKLEMNLSYLHKLIEASGKASNVVWAAALDELREAKECPGNIPAWMGSAIDRAAQADAHRPKTHVAHEGAADIDRKHRAYQRVAGRSRQGEP